MNARVPGLTLRKSPRKHQDEAFEGIDVSLATYNRAKVIMACGTGKTLVQLWANERRDVGLTIVFFPTLGLQSQSLREWRVQQSDDVPFRYICVCSDETVDAGDSANEADGDHLLVQGSVEFAPTTDSDVVRRFLTGAERARSFGQRSVVFCTYASAPVVAQAMRGIDGEFDLPPFGLGIFDEAHKTVGTEGKLNSFALTDERLPIRDRLFFTATPKIVETVATADDPHAMRVVSMENRQLYGDVAYHLGFAEAARRGLITRFQVVASFVNSANLTPEELASPDAKRIADTYALQDAMKVTGGRKAITFHSRVENALAFAQGISPSDMPAFHVNGKMPIRDRERQLAAFGRADTGVMTNANCLTEGVDVPTVDVVAFMDPRQDVVGIGQAAGRAMRTAPGKDMGYILVPLRVDLAGAETVEQAIDRGNFHQIIQVLRSLTENDGEEGAWATRLSGALESRDGAPPLLRIVGMGGPDEPGPVSIDVERIREAISTRILFGDDRFEQRMRELEVFRKKHNHCNVPKDSGSLGRWVAYQRQAAKKPGYPMARYARLDAIGFVWVIRASPLDSTVLLAQLEKFRQENGHCNVPQSPPSGLGRWVNRQRAMAKQPGYPKELRACLDAMGFVWEAGTGVRSEQRLVELIAFKQEHGHCNVPGNYPGGLGEWASQQRVKAKKPGYPEDRRARLDAIGFVWSFRATPRSIWEAWCGKLDEFRQEHGHCSVRIHHPGGLGQWVSEQRRRAKKPGYPVEYRARLDAMGFVWQLLSRASPPSAQADQDIGAGADEDQRQQFQEFRL
ncbi:DEAD/DEAH box helicase [uncultured Variovorax sp.]|uniref:DEAD/DEAH box helicase n=1 Tax=uncultured Variovorax sp. TaxID=114708 RepID=UPI0026172EF8|nr:DEAD/DEAH box helicase [uncultured Variovorax sp.]